MYFHYYVKSKHIATSILGRGLIFVDMRDQNRSVLMIQSLIQPGEFTELRSVTASSLGQKSILFM